MRALWLACRVTVGQAGRSPHRSACQFIRQHGGGGLNAREIQKLILMQILMFIRTFEKQRLWKIVYFAAVSAA